MNRYAVARPARPGVDAHGRGQAVHRLAQRAVIAVPVLVLLCLVVAVVARGGAIDEVARPDTARASLEAAPARPTVSDLQAVLVGPQPLGSPSTQPLVAVSSADPQRWLIGPQPLGSTTGRSSVLPSARDMHRDLIDPLPVTE